jgi:hypothetical protein
VRPVPNEWSITLAGLWNPGIFSYKWLGEHVFERTEIKIEYPTMPGVPVRYSANSVFIVPSGERVILAPTAWRDEPLKTCEDCARKILALLPHTPVMAVGVNLAFREPAPDQATLALLSCPVLAAAERKDFPHTAFFAQVSVPQGPFLMNVTMRPTHEAIDFAFNFHADVPNATFGEQILEGQFLRSRNTATQFLLNVFDLSVEDEL